jgi:hypothetical protein
LGVLKAKQEAVLQGDLDAWVDVGADEHEQPAADEFRSSPAQPDCQRELEAGGERLDLGDPDRRVVGPARARP